MGEVKAWPLATGEAVGLPQRIVRPCDHGLVVAINGLETQLGTIEAYNRLVEAAEQLRARIDNGGAKPQNPFFACNTGAVRPRRKR